MKNENVPLILISNDDSYQAKGLSELIDAVSTLGEVVVMAPNRPRSASGCSLTMNTPINYKLRYQDDHLTVFSCSGTPADCVKLALGEVLDCMPDLVISGINHGDNSSINAHYSGTMAAAFEGCMKGIPSIGFSLQTDDLNADFTQVLPYVNYISDMVLHKGLPPQVCLNVNFPYVPELKGIRICRQSQGAWTREFEQVGRRGDPNYYWMVGEFINTEPEKSDTDLWALDHGYAAVTPLTIDMTAYSSMARITQLFV